MTEWLRDHRAQLLIWAAVIGVSFVWPYFRPRLRKHMTASWPEVSGTVEHQMPFYSEGGILRQVFEQSKVLGYGFTYSYNVGGDYFSGDFLATDEPGFPYDQEDVARLYPTGSKVQVRYDPKNPKSSTIIPIEIPHESVYFPPRDDPRD